MEVMSSETQELNKGDKRCLFGIFEREWNSEQRELHKQRPVCYKLKTYSKSVA